ncbi:GntR family transcriptional regulator [Amycolatopsis jiangsuensis]|uniref:GntR family transcriptional regulator n=1 Tax=Amycolatopsis jiangsuensis TaxID=1181879 RepID=A0A840ILH5_9PSEU|nr:GntR family transcriptional regulator [Amycolatopsis jiangsuensis]MBB4683166.1 GntR family transcriptional regulator [Amycolatopsis jiangsuensis]
MRDAANRRSKTPLYRMIQLDLQRKILAGDLPRGSWLPSEAQLQRTYGASQTSVRRSLLELERLGLVERLQGRGTVIAANEVRAVSPMLGLGQELRQRGFSILAEVLENEIVEAGETIGARLGLGPREHVRRLRRRYSAEGTPLVLLEHHLRTDLVQGLQDFGGDSLYAFLLARDAAPHHAQERVFATNLDAREAELLALAPGTAALVRERTAFDGSGVAVEHTHYVLRSSADDGYQLEINLQATP